MTTLPWRWLWKTSLTSKYMGFSGSSLVGGMTLHCFFPGWTRLNQVFFHDPPKRSNSVFRMFSGLIDYPLINIQKAIENGHWNSGFTQLQNGGSFHSCVSLPEGMFPPKLQLSSCLIYERGLPLRFDENASLMRMVAWFHGDTTDTTTNHRNWGIPPGYD